MATTDEKIISLGVLSYNNDKMKEYIQDEIDKIPSSAVDDILSDISEHPVQNKVITNALNTKANLTDIPTSLPANGGNADIAKYIGTWGGAGEYYGEQLKMRVLFNKFGDLRFGLTTDTDNEIRVDYATNADTLGGKHTYDFFSRYPNLLTVDYVSRADMDTDYKGVVDVDTANSIGLDGSGSCWWHIIGLRNTNNDGYGTQIAIPLYSSNSNQIPKYRTSVGTTFQNWKNLSDGGNADTVGNLPASNFLGSSTNFNYHFANGAGSDVISSVKGESHIFAFNFTDTPTAYGFLDVSSFDGTGFSPAEFGLVRQVWTDWANPSERFVRIYKATSETDGVWTDWSRCNANTLDDKHASDFIYARGYFNSIDLDDIKYPCSALALNCVNSPSDQWGTLLVYEGGTGSFTQIFIPTADDGTPTAMYFRHYGGTGWTTWRNTADGGNAATANTAGTLATTASNICLRNLSSGTAAATTTNCPSGAWYGKHS